MNYRLLSKILGFILVLLSLAMLFCLGYAVLFEERRAGMDAVDALWISGAITAFSGAVLLFLGWNSGREILRKEAIAIVGLSWVVAVLFGALPYLLSEPRLGVVAAMFESASGFTTTGATVMDDLNRFPRSLLLWRALTQWLGGLGILVLFVALLTYFGVGSKALFRHESTAKSSEGLRAKIHDVAAILLKIYVAMSVLCCLGLWALGMTFYDALAHTFTAVSTGGFSPRNESIAAYDSLGIELWLVLFMILGGISFMLYAWLLRSRWERWGREEETRFFLGLLAAAVIVIAVDVAWLQPEVSLPEALRQSVFNVTSIVTTTGYATSDFDRWPPFSKILLLLLMFTGGCAGSTSGGIKVGRWVLFLKIVRAELIASFRPRQVISVRLNGNPAGEELRIQTVFFVALAGLSLGLGTALVSLLEPHLDITSCIGTVAATLFNIGPGFGAVGPAENFAHLSAGTQLLLAFLMLLGRLEFFAVLVLFVPSLWREY
jgi:trk system potassium uptake protein